MKRASKKIHHHEAKKLSDSVSGDYPNKKLGAISPPRSKIESLTAYDVINAAKSSYTSILSHVEEKEDGDPDTDDEDGKSPAVSPGGVDASEERERDEGEDPDFSSKVTSVLGVEMNQFYIFQRFAVTINQFNNRFASIEAVSCLMMNGDAASEAEAVELGNVMLSKNIIKSYVKTLGGSSFSTSKGVFYVFNEDIFHILVPVSLQKHINSISTAIENEILCFEQVDASGRYVDSVHFISTMVATLFYPYISLFSVRIMFSAALSLTPQVWYTARFMGPYSTKDSMV
jgi:hypothetical protein